ncbi:MAG: purine-nucleoside phosphorylase [Thermoanaerobacterales bacterium]|nr:purine-nucleoside phosphorylase [Thermoanaerobacterales bacterium]
MLTPPTDPFDLAQRAAADLARATGVERHDVAVVLGSGWRPAADRMGEVVRELATTDLPGFPEATVPGHAAAVRSIEAPGGRRVLAFLGRVHGYEGHGPETVVHPVRTAHAAGCSVVVLTNAAGGIREGLAVGQPVLIADHLNLTGRSPVAGPMPATGLPPRFVDLTDAYSGRLRDLAREVEPSLTEGVYAGLPGPHYETPAEIRMLRTLGADLVGMSTVWETIAARHLGLEVLGLSLVTNLAAGVGGVPLDHDEVLAAGRAAAERMGDLLAEVVRRL